MERTRSLRERLDERRVLLGMLQMQPNPTLVEMACGAGYDFMVLDAEHGALSDDDFVRSLQASANVDVSTFVRLAGHDPLALRRYLERGAGGIIVPHVSTAAEMQPLIDAAAPYRHASLLVLLESGLGVANAREILALNQVQGAFIGPNDLSADLGCTGDFTHPKYSQALLGIEQAAFATSKPIGTAPHGIYSVKTLIDRGHRLLLLGTDKSLLKDALSTQVAKAKSAFETNH